MSEITSLTSSQRSMLDAYNKLKVKYKNYEDGCTWWSLVSIILFVVLTYIELDERRLGLDWALVVISLVLGLIGGTALGILVSFICLEISISPKLAILKDKIEKELPVFYRSEESIDNANSKITYTIRKAYWKNNYEFKFHSKYDCEDACQKSYDILISKVPKKQTRVLLTNEPPRGRAAEVSKWNLFLFDAERRGIKPSFD